MTRVHEKQPNKNVKCRECGKDGKEICEECYEKHKNAFMQVVKQGYKDNGIELKSEKELNRDKVKL